MTTKTDRRLMVAAMECESLLKEVASCRYDLSCEALKMFRPRNGRVLYRAKV